MYLFNMLKASEENILSAHGYASKQQTGKILSPFDLILSF